MQDITSKWRTIRDNYTRNLKKQDECKRSGSAATKIRQYVYGEQLSFLRKTKELRNTDSSYATRLCSVVFNLINQFFFLQNCRNSIFFKINLNID